MSKLSIGNVVQVSILSALRGLADANTSALAIITEEIPVVQNYGNARAYLDPVAVAEDWGATSTVYAQAVAVFSQNPNILTGDGFLLIIPRDQTAPASAATILGSVVVDLTSLTADDYVIKAGADGDVPADLTIGEIDSSSISAAQASLNSTAVVAAGFTFVVNGTIAAARITLISATTGATSELEVVESAGTSTDIGPLLGVIGIALGSATGVETIKDCILRVYDSVAFFGLLLDAKPTDAVILTVAGLCQSLDKIFFIGSSVSDDVEGVFTDVLEAGYTNTRCLFYSLSAPKAVVFASGYACRGLSTNFDGTLTVSTMHLKDIIGSVADDGLTQTFVNACQAAGVDVYANFGVAKVFSSGSNDYFDEVYIRLALKLRLQIAGFNYLATTTTKIPDTESGMSGLKNAYRDVLNLFVTNGAFAPGAWLGTTFGNPGDFIRNISNFGYYIFSQPVAQQSQAQRNARVAPLVQLAAKASGAIHSSNVTVQIEA
jgi:hypothetical protein